MADVRTRTGVPLIYVAGPISSESESLIHDNVIRGRDAGIRLMRIGWSVVIPHMNSKGLHLLTLADERRYGHDFWMRIDLEILARCDAVLMLRSWQESKGAVMEHRFAEENGIMIFYESLGYPHPSEIIGEVVRHGDRELWTVRHGGEVHVRCDCGGVVERTRGPDGAGSPLHACSGCGSRYRLEEDDASTTWAYAPDKFDE